MQTSAAEYFSAEPMTPLDLWVMVYGKLMDTPPLPKIRVKAVEIGFSPSWLPYRHYQ
jgi:hypothetical protein